MPATYRTPNFQVYAPTRQVAQQIAETAEMYRRRLAKEWLGHELPRWYAPCTVMVRVGQVGAGGATTFSFDRGEVFGWKMNVQGSFERILDSVLPHEISHTIFACHFRRPLPRWADEGAATLVEHESERKHQRLLAHQLLTKGGRIPLKSLFAIKEYPQDMQQVLSLYAEGYSLADFLVQQGGKRRFLRFLGDAHEIGWEQALTTHYQFASIESLESDWRGWVIAGSPALQQPAGTILASNSASDNGTKSAELVVRSQSPEPTTDYADVEPSTVAKEQRGVGLHAPDPRQHAVASAGARISTTLAAGSRSTNGWQRARQAGWVPVKSASQHGVADSRSDERVAAGNPAGQALPTTLSHAPAGSSAW